MTEDAETDLEEALTHLARGERLALEDWPSDTISPDMLGLEASGGTLAWPQLPQSLDEGQLKSLLPELSVEVRHAVGSTNTIVAADLRVLDRRLMLAEFQHGGRGRRGRQWLSPYARNLAMSLGFRTSRSLAELGGLSSVVGLAIASELESLQIPGVALKWPNDVLINDEKICGILVELVQDTQGVGVVVGSGFNVVLQAHERATIGQPVTDLRCHGVTQSRTELAAGFAASIWRFLQHFESKGFEPFRASFDAVHKFHQQRCTVLQGEHKISGVVVGIGPQGELLLRTHEGIQEFHGGEVSLRPGVASGA